MIIGTKTDLRDDKVSLLRLDRLQNQKPITVEEGYLFSRRYDSTSFHECSAISHVSVLFFIKYFKNSFNISKIHLILKNIYKFSNFRLE